MKKMLKAVRPSVLGVVLLGAMGAMTATSGIVLATSGPSPLAACGGSCYLASECSGGALACQCTGVDFPTKGSCSGRPVIQP